MKARFARACLWCLVSVCTFVTGAAAGGDVRVFDIPGGEAEDLIALFSQQSQKSILAPGDALIGIKTAAVRGAFSSAAALSMLLEGTRLEVAMDDGRTVVLRIRVDSEPFSTGNASILRDTVPLETVTVTGYRASLTNSTYAKRTSISFTDSVFTEDIGKFPDSNIAEF